jgi:hypothetical protein
MSQFYDSYHNASYFIVPYKKISWHFSPRRSILILGSGDLSSLWCTVAVRRFEGSLSMPPSGRSSYVNIHTFLNGHLSEVCEKRLLSAGIKSRRCLAYPLVAVISIFAQPSRFKRSGRRRASHEAS